MQREGLGCVPQPLSLGRLAELRAPQASAKKSCSVSSIPIMTRMTLTVFRQVAGGLEREISANAPLLGCGSKPHALRSRPEELPARDKVWRGKCAHVEFLQRQGRLVTPRVLLKRGDADRLISGLHDIETEQRK